MVSQKSNLIANSKQASWFSVQPVKCAMRNFCETYIISLGKQKDYLWMDTYKV